MLSPLLHVSLIDERVVVAALWRRKLVRMHFELLARVVLHDDRVLRVRVGVGNRESEGHIDENVACQLVGCS